MSTMSLLDRIGIEHACMRLSIDYSYFADKGQMDDWARLFAEDAELVVMGKTASGREAIRKSVSVGSETITFHSTSNIRIDVVSPSEARGTVPVTVYVTRRDGEPTSVATITPTIIGVYSDDYRLTNEGWLFAKRSFAAVLTQSAT